MSDILVNPRPDIFVEVDVGGGSALPEGGEPGQVLTKTEEGAAWRDPAEVAAAVTSVNGKTGDVEITPENIGALPKEALPEAIDAALAQAKESGEFDGAPGEDGVSPIVKVEETSSGGAVITVTDKNGTTSATVKGAKEPLIGMSSEITPQQVAQAIMDGRSATVGHGYELYGTTIFSEFALGVDMGMVAASVAFEMNGDIGNAHLVGYIETGEWVGNVVPLAKVEDIPDIPTELPNPHALRFTGASTGLYDGSESLTIHIPTGSGGSGITEIPIASPETLGGIKVGNNLLIDGNGVLSVNTTNDMEQDNTRPITSAGVYVTVGNIEALLKTI